ncbi:DUF4867 family protein [Vibrio campbellii]|uniref:DUF4867 family protein n=1 Tax=Vibrio campbellii TaxID=680 RepID=UPI001F08457E|nr:DUF4867 family protein [Vibrio campbellii]UMM04834.1 DUF4867 family protein [Vibrio campbellii]
MKTLQTLNDMNPSLNIKKVSDSAFKAYGQLITGHDFSELSEFCLKNYYDISHTGTYVPDNSELSELAVIQSVANEVYGDMPLQVGYVTGQNQSLTGLEYHQGSETIIAITDMVLILGRRELLADGYYASKDCQAFFLEAGQGVELYSTTLHYTPCKVDENAFLGVVFLPKGTNNPLDQKSQSKLLFKSNKWFITHASQAEKVKQGAFPGLTGQLIELQF